MTMKAFAVVISRVEAYRFGCRWFPKILDVYVTHASPFGTDPSIQHIVGVTRIAGFVGWNAVILEMSSGEVLNVIHVKTFSEWLHDVA
jgi:hypothetical protein